MLVLEDLSPLGIFNNITYTQLHRFLNMQLITMLGQRSAALRVGESSRICCSGLSKIIIRTCFCINSTTFNLKMLAFQSFFRQDLLLRYYCTWLKRVRRDMDTTVTSCTNCKATQDPNKKYNRFNENRAILLVINSVCWRNWFSKGQVFNLYIFSSVIRVIAI